MTAPLLAIMAALLFAISTNVIKKGMAYVDAQTASLISISATTLCYLLSAPFWMKGEYWQSPGVWVFVLIGLIQPVFSRYLAYEANRRVGPTISATFDAVTPLFAAVMAIFALGESLTWSIALGTVVIVAGVILVSWNSQGVRTIVRIALLFALGASFIRALSTNIGRYGMTILPSAMMASFVSFAVSVLGALLLYRFQKGKLPSQIPQDGVIWCGLSGVISAAAVACMYSALLYGKVIVVSPILSTYPIFTLGVALLFRVESPTRRTAAGVFLVVVGVIFVTLRSAG